MDPDTPAPPIKRSALPPKGRGAVRNIAHRFSTEIREAEEDGWHQELPPSPKTRLGIDQAKTVISWNESPDLPFDRSINPYRGCEHGCIYCYARPTHAWLGLSPGLDFETQLFHKPDAVDRLRAELSAPGYRCAPIALGANTDPWQPIERDTQTTRQLLELLLATRHPVDIFTKGALIGRDLDLLQEMAKHHLVRVSLSVTTLDAELARKLEPRASTPPARLRALGQLADAGVPTAIYVAPLIPGLTDHEMESILKAGQANGAQAARYALLRLPHEVAPLFLEWLDCHAPEKSGRILSILYDLRGQRLNASQFGTRMTGLGHFASLIRQRFELACRRLGLGTETPPLDAGQFTPPAARFPPGTPQQGSLF